MPNDGNDNQFVFRGLIHPDGQVELCLVSWKGYEERLKDLASKYGTSPDAFVSYIEQCATNHYREALKEFARTAERDPNENLHISFEELDRLSDEISRSRKARQRFYARRRTGLDGPSGKEPD